MHHDIIKNIIYRLITLKIKNKKLLLHYLYIYYNQIDLLTFKIIFTNTIYISSYKKYCIRLILFVYSIVKNVNFKIVLSNLTINFGSLT